jgi:hypothetical protein
LRLVRSRLGRIIRKVEGRPELEAYSKPRSRALPK